MRTQRDGAKEGFMVENKGLCSATPVMAPATPRKHLSVQLTSMKMYLPTLTEAVMLANWPHLQFAPVDMYSSSTWVGAASSPRTVTLNGCNANATGC